MSTERVTKQACMFTPCKIQFGDSCLVCSISACKSSNGTSVNELHLRWDIVFPSPALVCRPVFPKIYTQGVARTFVLFRLCSWCFWSDPDLNKEACRLPKSMLAQRVVSAQLSSEWVREGPARPTPASGSSGRGFPTPSWCIDYISHVGTGISSLPTNFY